MPPDLLELSIAFKQQAIIRAHHNTLNEYTPGPPSSVSGATLKELMARLGHPTPAAAMIYQHAWESAERAYHAAVAAGRARIRLSEIRARVWHVTGTKPGYGA